MIKPQIWFAGTPEFATAALDALVKHISVAGVLTQPDRPAGRGRKLKASAVKARAEHYQLPIAQPERLQESAPPFAHLPRPDIVVVVAYGLLLPQWFLDYPRLGCINIHASLLPRWRGAAPIQRAIEAGDEETGISIMQMDAGLDTGAVWLEKRLPIGEQSASQLHDALMQLGAEALIDVLPDILAQARAPIPQPSSGACYAHKLSKAEAEINWQDDAANIVRKIRAFDLFPVAHSYLDDAPVRFYDGIALSEHTESAPAGTVIEHNQEGIDIVCGSGILRIKRLQLAGKNVVSAAALANGCHLKGRHFARKNQL